MHAHIYTHVNIELSLISSVLSFVFSYAMFKKTLIYDSEWPSSQT